MCTKLRLGEDPCTFYYTWSAVNASPTPIRQAQLSTLLAHSTESLSEHTNGNNCVGCCCFCLKPIKTIPAMTEHVTIRTAIAVEDVWCAALPTTRSPPALVT